MRSVVAVNFCDTHFCGNIVQWISARRWLIEQSAPSRVPLAQPVMSHEEFLCCEVCVWQADLIIANEKKNWEEATFWQAQSIFYDLSQHIKILLHFEMLIGRPAFDFSAKIDDVWTGFFSSSIRHRFVFGAQNFALCVTFKASHVCLCAVNNKKIEKEHFAIPPTDTWPFSSPFPQIFTEIKQPRWRRCRFKEKGSSTIRADTARSQLLRTSCYKCMYDDLRFLIISLILRRLTQHFFFRHARLVF